MFVTFGETALRLAPGDGDRLESTDSLRVETAGPESNAAVAARRYGVDATWCSALPDSPLGRRVAGEIRGYDVDVRAATREGRQGLAFYERGAAPRGDRAVADRDGAAVAGIDAADLPLDLVASADVAYVTGATPALSSAAASATVEFIKAARDGDPTVAFGLRYLPDRWPPEEAREALTGLFPAVDALVAREEDVERVLDRDGQPTEVAHALASTHGFETVALLCDGTALGWHDSTFFERQLVDAGDADGPGAEDAFAGAFLAALSADGDTDRALRYGTAAHALARTLPGPVPAFTRAELDRVAEDVASAGEDR